VQDTGDLPELAVAYDARPRPGGGFVIDELTPRLGGLVLHHGPILVTLEAAALEAGGVGARVEELSVRIVKAGKRGPFFATASVLSENTDVVLVRADLREGADGLNLIATGTLRLRKSH
jgi:acyl-coenzyme A thioesterase PaaI-like protein